MSLPLEQYIFPKGGNYSGHAIVAYYAIAQLFGTRWTLRFKGLDQNNLPRDSIARAEASKKVPAKFLAYVKRRNAAHYNALENMSLFVGTIILLNIAKVPTEEINWYAGFIVATRLLYTIIYAAISNELLATVRTVVWWVNMLTSLRYLLIAGNKLS